ncbi:MAG: helix-turn-helix transcriptional regulator [Eubacteriales bacterium]|nr:helix-turn-helix transcriptional regulator [Eubacteriales bacterium]
MNTTSGQNSLSSRTEMNHTLENLICMAHGMAREFGRDCEVCIHDLNASDLEHTIVYIINGHVTGRESGDGPSKIVLESIEAMKKGEPLSDHLGYLTHTQSGRILKSSTMFMKGDDGQYRYIVAVNYDITALVSIETSVKSLIAVEEANEKTGAIPTNVNDLLDTLIEQSVQMIGKLPALMTKDEKVRAIQYLNDCGAFLITRSGDKVSSYFGISKFTLYSYIDVNKGAK